MNKNLKFLVAIPLAGFAIQAYAADPSQATYPNTSGASYDNTRPAASATTTTTSTTTTDMNKNARGSKAAGSPSVLDQSSGSSADVEVTRTIREALNDSDSLSTSAKNIEVVTLNNSITLRGAVASQAERTQVISAAQRVAGNRQIRNEITVDSTKR